MSKLIAILRSIFRRQPARDDQWRARCIAGTWYVSRQVGDIIENLHYPPPGYRDGSVLASFKNRREASKAAAKANVDATSNN